VLLIAILGMGVFHLATIKRDHPWGDDFALYILEARNIAHWHDITDTGYIYNPTRPKLGPRAYPPGFPLLLVPVYSLFGLNLIAMKVEVIVLFLGAVFLLALVLRDDLSPSYLLVFALLLGLSPVYWEFKNYVDSDLPFLFLVALALYLAHGQTEWGWTSRRPYLFGVAFGAVLYLAYATRTLGIVLVPVVVLAELVRTRRLGRSTLVAGGVFVALALLQSVVMGSTWSYIDQLHPSWESVWRNMRLYPRVLDLLWRHHLHVDWAARALGWVIAALAAVGFLARLPRRGLDPIALFPLLYPIPLVAWPAYAGIRYLIPWIPFYLFFALAGLRWLGQRLAGRPGSLVALGVMTAIVLTAYVGMYRRENFEPFPLGATSLPAEQLYRFVRTHTKPTDVFIMSKPKAFALYAGRRTSALQRGASPLKSWTYIHRIGASYIVEGPVEYDQAERLVGTYNSLLSQVFANELFRVYAIGGAGGAVGSGP
jgi:hypothetical protein